MGKTVQFLYRFARLVNDIEKLSSGNPKRIGKRFANKIIGRKIARRLYLK